MSISKLRLCYFLFLALVSSFSVDAAPVQLGVDRLFTPQYEKVLRGKQIGLITNHTAVNIQNQSTINLIKKNAANGGYKLKALFAPEHGLTGNQYASEDVQNSKDIDGIPIYSLHGVTRRPTATMLKNITLLIYDIQDIGSRSYTYITTLFYVMEEAAKLKIPVIVLDRPNPINGLVVDGPMLNEKLRSMVGYINIPYCHGMTIGELARYFNSEYRIGCSLTVVPMNGWKRNMTFQDTQLRWIPTSPQIPESNTSFYYPMTGLLGELQLVNIGVGYTLPFKVVGAPWIKATELAQNLNNQKSPGVHFHPFYFRPFFGRYAHENCEGVLISITNPLIYQPVSTQFLMIGTLKNLYPKAFQKAFQLDKDKIEMFNKLSGTTEVYRVIKDEKFITWTLKALDQKERAAFIEKRKKYLLPEYELIQE
ncbi:MAG: DUF1343 domain-containing protein [Parachlamydiaceae bacterium]|nr:DUF1343 domain-containing protein [Parachlamydiaceae bacterium]